MDITEEDLQGLYTWVDEIPLSRPKRNISRDFADGVLLAELVGHYFPKLVELHNYSSANGMQQKLYNWTTLNNKVLKRLGMQLSREHMQEIATGVPGAIEEALRVLKVKIASFQEDGSGRTTPRGDALAAAGSLTATHAGFAAALSSSKARMQGLAGSPGQQQQSEALAEKERSICELRETNEILETKVRKLEQLVKLKDAKISTLVAKLQAAGVA
ncbi:Spef1 [Scenedesmus sp. PABB004]|nr:Spef1 [Scenedesmus sp. PABB004]